MAGYAATEVLDGDVKGVRLAGDRALAHVSEGMEKRMVLLVGDVKGARIAGDQALAQLTHGMGKRMEELVRLDADRLMAQFTDGLVAAPERRVEASLVKMRAATCDLVVKSMLA